MQNSSAPIKRVIGSHGTQAYCLTFVAACHWQQMFRVVQGASAYAAETLAGTRSPIEGTTQERWRPTSGIAISSIRFATLSCRRRGSRTSGGSDTAPPGANLHLPRSETNARPNALRRANRLSYRRGVLSEKRKLHWRWRPPSTRRTPFASRTNWSRFPPVRNIVPLWLAASLRRKEPPPEPGKLPKVIQF